VLDASRWRGASPSLTKSRGSAVTSRWRSARTACGTRGWCSASSPGPGLTHSLRGARRRRGSRSTRLDEHPRLRAHPRGRAARAPGPAATTRRAAGFGGRPSTWTRWRTRGPSGEHRGRRPGRPERRALRADRQDPAGDHRPARGGSRSSSSRWRPRTPRRRRRGASAGTWWRASIAEGSPAHRRPALVRLTPEGQKIIVCPLPFWMLWSSDA